ALGIDAVVDLRNAMRRHADLAFEILLEVARERDIAADEWPVQRAHVLVATALAVGIGAVPPLLPVDANRDACSPGRHYSLERRKVAGMHYGRPQPAEQPVKARVIAHEMARTFVELDEFHVGPLHPLGKAAGNAREREHGVTPALGRHAI